MDDDRGARWCRLLAVLRGSDPAFYHAVIEGARAVVQARKLDSNTIDGVDTHPPRIVLLSTMPPVVTDSCSQEGAQSATSAYLAELRRRRERDDRLFAEARERIERTLSRCEVNLALARQLLARRRK
jgi:hypothetical protein